MANRWDTDHLTVEERFHHYTQVGDGCWAWNGTRNAAGYGVISSGKGVKTLAHRYSYEHHIGPINGLHVLHKCDNPSCVNPQHLFLGTDADNHTDKAKKLRAGKKLTPQQVKDIKKVLKTDHPKLEVIAAQYGVCRKSIQRIKHENYWRFA